MEATRFVAPLLITLGSVVFGGFVMLAGLGETFEYGNVLRELILVISATLEDWWLSVVPSIQLDLTNTSTIGLVLPYLALTARLPGTPPSILAMLHDRALIIFGIWVTKLVKPQLKNRDELRRTSFALGKIFGLTAPILLLFLIFHSSVATMSNKTSLCKLP